MRIGTCGNGILGQPPSPWITHLQKDWLARCVTHGDGNGANILSVGPFTPWRYNTWRGLPTEALHSCLKLVGGV